MSHLLMPNTSGSGLGDELKFGEGSKLDIGVRNELVTDSISGSFLVDNTNGWWVMPEAGG